LPQGRSIALAGRPTNLEDWRQGVRGKEEEKEGQRGFTYAPGVLPGPEIGVCAARHVYSELAARARPQIGI